MDLVSVPEFEWFEFDHFYFSDMAERRRLLATAHGEVFAATPVSDAARQEALDLTVAALTTHHPDWFSLDQGVLCNHLTGESWLTANIDRRERDKSGAARSTSDATTYSPRLPSAIGEAGSHSAVDPLELAGRLVQEDLCLIQAGSDGPIFTAAVLCFPSRWRLMDKIGKPLSAVHGPVPRYADRLAAPVDRFMRHLKPNHIASRLNWSLLDDPALFQPSGKWRADSSASITTENAGQHVFLRVERQTLRRLPSSGAVLFGIRVHVYPLEQIIDRLDRAAALADAVRALPAEIQHYKSLLPFREVLLSWLARRSEK